MFDDHTRSRGRTIPGDNEVCASHKLTSFSESGSKDELNSILKDIGELGPWQWFLALVNMIMTINAGIQNNSYPMLVGSSNNWAYACRVKGDTNFTLEPDYQSCKVALSPVAAVDPVQCSESSGHEMVYKHEHFDTAMITDFNLMCGYVSYLVPLVHSAFTIGSFFGVFLFGWLADWAGRKKALCIGIPIMIILNFALSFSPNIYVFLAIRLVQGTCVFGTFTVAFVISVETTAPSKRAMIGNIVHIPWGLQFITVSLVALWLRHWRYQQVVYSIPSLACLICLTPWLTESPRWLAINGKIDEATKVFLQGANWNRKRVSEQSIRDRLQTFYNRAERNGERVKSNMKLAAGLVKTPEMRRRFLFSAVVWFQGAFTNHGINFYAPTLAANPFLAYCLVGLFEFMSPVIGAALFTYGRRVPLVILFAVCGFISYNIITVMKLWPEGHEFQLLGMLLFATLLSDMAFNGIYVHVSEFMPTTHRSIGLGSCSSIARIGSSLSSVLVQTANQHPYLPPVVFGSLSLVGSFCTFMLPSTENKELPETIEEVEQHSRRSSFKIKSDPSVGERAIRDPEREKRLKKPPQLANGFCEEKMIQNVTCV